MIFNDFQCISIRFRDILRLDLSTQRLFGALFGTPLERFCLLLLQAAKPLALGPPLLLQLELLPLILEPQSRGLELRIYMDLSWIYHVLA